MNVNHMAAGGTWKKTCMQTGLTSDLLSATCQFKVKGTTTVNPLFYSSPAMNSLILSTAVFAKNTRINQQVIYDAAKAKAKSDKALLLDNLKAELESSQAKFAMDKYELRAFIRENNPRYFFFNPGNKNAAGELEPLWMPEQFKEVPRTVLRDFYDNPTSELARANWESAPWKGSDLVNTKSE